MVAVSCPTASSEAASPEKACRLHIRRSWVAVCLRTECGMLTFVAGRCHLEFVYQESGVFPGQPHSVPSPAVLHSPEALGWLCPGPGPRRMRFLPKAGSLLDLLHLDIASVQTDTCVLESSRCVSSGYQQSPWASTGLWLPSWTRRWVAQEKVAARPHVRPGWGQRQEWDRGLGKEPTQRPRQEEQGLWLVHLGLLSALPQPSRVCSSKGR